MAKKLPPKNTRSEKTPAKLNWTRNTSGKDSNDSKKKLERKASVPRKTGPESNRSTDPKPGIQPRDSPESSLSNDPKPSTDPKGIRLNRYIAHAGVCSRREADELIADGQIRVNNKLVTEMGYKVMPGEKVYLGKKLLRKEAYAYVLLNKPKGFITTTKDPQERKTVMDLVKTASDVRLYPVGRLDRNTTGLLLLTNDGDMADRLSHPSNNIKKIYKAELDKPILKEDFENIIEGIELEDGPIKVDDLAIITSDNLSIGVEIHSGKNRIVRRIFEHFGYEVIKLDRVVYAGLDKSNLPRGKWRHLSEKEIGLLSKKGRSRS